MKIQIKQDKWRPLMRAFFFLISGILFIGCSQISSLYKRTNPIVPNDQIPSTSDQEYVHHFEKLDSFIKQNRGIKIKRLSRPSLRYLKGVFNRIISNNELLLEGAKNPEFNLVIDRTPYLFSLPGYRFYFSSGLIKKYLKNESLLLSALTFEIIKSGRNIFERRRVIPIGVMTIKEALTLTKVDFKTKMAIYQWTYYALRRSNYDGAAILNWIQTQNKNSLDFSWQIRDPQGVTREESAFKKFLVAQGVDQFDNEEINSSSGFYRFRDRI